VTTGRHALRGAREIALIRSLQHDVATADAARARRNTEEAERIHREGLAALEEEERRWSGVLAGPMLDLDLMAIRAHALIESERSANGFAADRARSEAERDAKMSALGRADAAATASTEHVRIERRRNVARREEARLADAADHHLMRAVSR